MNYVAIVVIVILAALILRGLVRDARRARDDLSDLRRNPTALKIAGTLWTLYFIVAIVYTFMSTRDIWPMLVVFAAYFGAAFDLSRQAKANGGGAITLRDLVVNIFLIVCSIPPFLWLLGQAPGYAAMIGLFAALGVMLAGVVLDQRRETF